MSIKNIAITVAAVIVIGALGLYVSTSGLDVIWDYIQAAWEWLFETVTGLIG